MKPMQPLYYEAHVTLKEWNPECIPIARELGFRVSEFTNGAGYDKREEQIITGKARSLPLLMDHLTSLLEQLGLAGVLVARNKIEAAIVDTKPIGMHRGFLDG